LLLQDLFQWEKKDKNYKKTYNQDEPLDLFLFFIPAKETKTQVDFAYQIL
jgi:hypothetical protein